MSANLSAVPKLQFFDNNGNPLVAGKLYTYAAGTTTPLATYTDASAVTPNTNPVILDSRGEANVWLTAESYKFVLKDASDVTIWTVDNVSNAINTSQILASSGSAAAPPYTFASDTTTGMYLGAIGQLGLAVAGVPVIRATDTVMTFGQSGGSNDVDVIHYGDTTQTGDIGLTGAFVQTGDMTVNGAAVFNEAGADKDFRVEGDGDPNLLFVDASTDRVGISTATPAYLFDVQGSLGAMARIGDATRDLIFGNELATAYIESTSNFTIKTASAPRLYVTTTGLVGINELTPQQQLHVTVLSGVTNSVSQAMRIDKQISGTPGAGAGVGMEFAVETAAANTEVGATIEAVSTDVTAGSEDFDLSFKTMAAGAVAAERLRVTSTSLLQFNSGYGSVATAYGCRAWVNFDGTGTPAVRASGNVSSITDGGTGLYTVNFSSALPDANYNAVVSASGGGGTYDNATSGLFSSSAGALGTYSTTAVQIWFSLLTNAATGNDREVVNVAVFR